MASVLLNLLPLIVVAALVPFPVIIGLRLLGSERGVVRASAFTGGMVLTRLVQGVLFGQVVREAESEMSTDVSKKFSAMLLLVVGVLMIVSGIRLLLKEADPDEPPKWMQMIDRLGLVKSFGLGVLLVVISAKQWVFMLSGIAIIGDGDLGLTKSTICYLVYVIGASSLLLIPLIARLAAPAKTEPVLLGVVAWLERNNRYIKMAVSFIFGLYFLSKALSTLLG